MDDKERQALATLVRNRRIELGLSGREIARRAGIDNATVTLIEQCKIAQPRIDTVQALATALELPVTDFYSAMNWLPDNSMPSLRPYMRAKYQDLPEAAVDEVEKFVDWIADKYRSGPANGEDE